MTNSITTRDDDTDARESGACMCREHHGVHRSLHIWGSKGCKYEPAAEPSNHVED